MKLTRRDAIAALAAIGGGGVGYAAHRQNDDAAAAGADGVADDETVRETLVAAAEVVYPSEVDGIEAFVTTFLDGRLDSDRRADRRLGPAAEADATPGSATDHDAENADGLRTRDGAARSGFHETVATLNERAVEWHGAPFPELSPPTRDQLLRELGTHTADERPDGTTAERVRYYVVNELLLALYSSPTGGELVGIENPQGHPGGIESYQRGP
jgi:hypothetical protein